MLQTSLNSVPALIKTNTDQITALKTETDKIPATIQKNEQEIVTL